VDFIGNLNTWLNLSHVGVAGRYYVPTSRDKSGVRWRGHFILADATGLRVRAPHRLVLHDGRRALIIVTRMSVPENGLATVHFDGVGDPPHEAPVVWGGSRMSDAPGSDGQRKSRQNNPAATATPPLHARTGAPQPASGPWAPGERARSSR
jgi:hypothetical protein